MKILKYFISTLLLVSCTKKNENSYNFNVTVKENNPKIKLSLVVNLYDRIEEDSIRKLAFEFYETYNGADYENVFIGYLLPDMIEGNGFYASSHFNPDLKVELYELSGNEILKIKKNFQIRDRYWIDRKILIEIEKKEKSYFLNQYGSDLSFYNQPLIYEVIHADTIFKETENEFGEYYILDSNNNLFIYDDRGLIKNFTK